MLRGLALAILLVNLALLLWGSSRPEPQGSPLRVGGSPSDENLPTLVLIEETREDPVAPLPADLCMRIGPLDPRDADALEGNLVAWSLDWQRREGAEGWVLEVGPGRSPVWPENELRAIAGALAAEISPCRTPDPIAPEPSRP